MRRSILLTLAAAMASVLVPQAGAQTPFSIRVQQGTNVQFLSDGGTMAFPADGIGRATEGDIAIQYTGTGATALVNINQILLSGSTDFAVTSGPDLSAGPLNLVPGSPAFGMHVRYTPSNSKGATARLTFNYSNEANRTGSFSIVLAGSAPEFGYTYQVQPNGNTTLLSPGATVPLPQTALNATSSVVITLTNRGTAPGTVNNIGMVGSDKLVLSGVPFLPATVNAGATLQFSVRFTPIDTAAVSGDVQVDFPGSSLAFKVSGSGLAAAYSYAVVGRTAETSIDAGGLIRLPEATVGGEKTTVTVRVTNTGNDNGQVSTLSVSGTGFALVETPFLPYTLAPNASVTFKIQFAPTQPGKTTGSLRINNDNFTVEGNALGANLTYFYAAAGGTTSLASGGTVVLPAVAVGDTSSVQFTIKNDGTASQDVFSITAAGTGTVFSVSGLPSLPRHIEAGASVTFTVTFAPMATGASTGTLKVDTQTFTLSGSGNAPSALPSYSFSGASGAVDPVQQPAVGLALASPYNLALNGTLTLKFTSEVFADDPSVQFASGGRTVSFTIPAGSTQAVFANGATQMRVQSGTVAGTITVTPSFATAGGGIDLTPASPQSLTLTLAQAAPKLLNVVVSSKSNNTFTLLITGYATGRSITQMDFQFAAVSTENLGTTKVSLPVESTFNAWYQGSTSAAYGSQFTATVPFTMAGDIKDTKTIAALADTLQSVTVTLTNRQGVSNAVSVNLK